MTYKNTKDLCEEIRKIAKTKWSNSILTIADFTFVSEFEPEISAKVFMDFDQVVPILEVPLDHETVFLEILQGLFSVLILKLWNVYILRLEQSKIRRRFVL